MKRLIFILTPFLLFAGNLSADAIRAQGGLAWSKISGPSSFTSRVIGETYGVGYWLGRGQESVSGGIDMELARTVRGYKVNSANDSFSGSQPALYFYYTHLDVGYQARFSSDFQFGGIGAYTGLGYLDNIVVKNSDYTESEVRPLFRDTDWIFKLRALYGNYLTERLDLLFMFDFGLGAIPVYETLNTEYRNLFMDFQVALEYRSGKI